VGKTGPSLQHGPCAALTARGTVPTISIPDAGPVQAAKGTWRRAVMSLKTGPAQVTGLNMFLLDPGVVVDGTDAFS